MAIFSNSVWVMKLPCLRILTATALACLLSGCERKLTGDFICQLPANEATKIGLPELKLVSPEFAAGYFPPSYAENGFACGKSCKPIIGTHESFLYPEFLEAASEESLYKLSQKPISGSDYTLRFTWLRTMHHPVIILVIRRGKSFTMIAKELSGQGGYEPGKIQRTVVRPLAAASARKFQAVLESKGLFDQLPGFCGVGGLDGSRWLFEIADKHGYRIVQRSTPSEGPAHDIGMLLLDLTGWQFGEIY